MRAFNVDLTVISSRTMKTQSPDPGSRGGEGYFLNAENAAETYFGERKGHNHGVDGIKRGLLVSTRTLSGN